MILRTLILCLCALGLEATSPPEVAPTHPPAQPFGSDFPKLDHAASGAWWNRTDLPPWQAAQIQDRDRSEAVAFALYTHDAGVLKLTAQMAPLLPDEPREAVLKITDPDGNWQVAGTAAVLFPGWSAHFRVEDWDSRRTARYQVSLGEVSTFEGTIRADPVNKDEIVVAVLSCNSNKDRGDRAGIVHHLQQHDPDLLFFAGDQSYDHREHTAAWLVWGWQFRDIIRDRPTITIPDDHDIGQGNLWGAGGIKAPAPTGNAGGYYFPAEYVNMVERCQTWHLPDAFDPTKIARGIGVYYTRLRVGGIDFAILEDRKFKSGPNGNIPPMGPRPDHINDPSYDREAVDLPHLKLLGDRQLEFLDAWVQDWQGAVMKVALSQTAFAGAVHIHGRKEDRLLADLDSNAWPQTGRNEALRRLRRVRAAHLAGDQHLAVVLQHGIENFGDGPFGFTTPAIVNNYYSRWWRPLDGAPGNHRPDDDPLPWTGEYLDGLGNKMTMLTYVNPGEGDNGHGDGFGIARFRKSTGDTVFEFWPRLSSYGSPANQTPGWPVRFNVADNDGREPTGWLEVPLPSNYAQNPVVAVTDQSTGELLYVRRFEGGNALLPVWGPGPFKVKSGQNRPDTVLFHRARPRSQ